MVNARYDDLFGRENLSYILGTHVEEMLGTVVFSHALLSHISLYSEGTRVRPGQEFQVLTERR